MCYPEVTRYRKCGHGLGQVARLIAAASVELIRHEAIPSHALDGWSEGAVEGAEVVNLDWFRCMARSRPRVVVSNVITPRSSADLKRPPLVVVLESPLVTADDA